MYVHAWLYACAVLVTPLVERGCVVTQAWAALGSRSISERGREREWWAVSEEREKWRSNRGGRRRRRRGGKGTRKRQEWEVIVESYQLETSWVFLNRNMCSQAMGYDANPNASVCVCVHFPKDIDGLTSLTHSLSCIQVEACLLAAHMHDSHTRAQTHTHTPLNFPSLQCAEPPEPMAASRLHPDVFIIMNYHWNYIRLSGEIYHNIRVIAFRASSSEAIY